VLVGTAPLLKMAPRLSRRGLESEDSDFASAANPSLESTATGVEDALRSSASERV